MLLISRCSQNAQHNRYRKARDIRPDIAVMHLNLAQAVDERGEGDPVASYREALRLDPTLTKAHCGLFNTLMYRLEWKDRNAMLRDLQPDNQDIMDCVRSFYAATFSLSSVQSLSVARREARDARQKALLQQQHSCWNNSRRRRSHRPLRVTFASSDFGAHTVGHLVHRLFERYDESRLHIRGVALSPDDGTFLRATVRNVMKSFEIKTVSSSDRDVFDALTRDESDLVIDLNGFSRGERSSAISSVNLAATYLGFPSSTGGLHDISITDSVATPVEISSQLYDESLLVFTSSSYMISSHADTYPMSQGMFNTQKIANQEHRDSIDRILELKRQGRFILCNFGQLYKMTPNIISAWADIMKSLPHSILWMVHEHHLNTHTHTKGSKAKNVFTGTTQIHERSQCEKSEARTCNAWNQCEISCCHFTSIRSGSSHRNQTTCRFIFRLIPIWRALHGCGHSVERCSSHHTGG